MPTRDRMMLFLMTHSAPYGKPKCLGSGGSMVARLKLKGIDGRAPPGVELAAQMSNRAVKVIYENILLVLDI